jgi:hypothetical protein
MGLLTLTANSTVRLDILDFSDFFDFRSDVPPEIKDLRTRGFGFWLAFSSSEGIQELKRRIAQNLLLLSKRKHVSIPVGNLKVDSP